MCVFWTGQPELGSETGEWGYQGSFLGSFVAAVSVNFRQDKKKRQRMEKGWTNAKEKLVRRRRKEAEVITGG